MNAVQTVSHWNENHRSGQPVKYTDPLGQQHQTETLSHAFISAVDRKPSVIVIGFGVVPISMLEPISKLSDPRDSGGQQ